VVYHGMRDNRKIEHQVKESMSLDDIDRWMNGDEPKHMRSFSIRFAMRRTSDGPDGTPRFMAIGVIVGEVMPLDGKVHMIQGIMSIEVQDAIAAPDDFPGLKLGEIGTRCLGADFDHLEASGWTREKVKT